MTGGQAQTPGRGAGPYNGWDAFEAFVHRIMDEEQIPGVSVAFARHGELVYARGFGFRDREAGIPADAATVYGVASVTKSFTAMAIMKLQDEGKLSVHDPVRRYLPGFSLHDPEGVAGGGADVTIHHLLSHTSGLPPLGARRGVLPGGVPADPPLPAPPTLEALLRYLAEQPYRLLGAPGEHLSYCNDGYALLGAVVERVSGRPFTEFVRQEILEPAGMTRSTFDEAVLRSFPAVTQLYERTPDGAVAASPGWPEWGLYASSGALRSTVLDLLRYLEIYRNGGRVSGVNILSPAALAAMTTPVYEYLPGVHYAYGLTVRRLEEAGVTLIGHSGNQKGIAAHVGYVPEAGITGAVLLNLGQTPAADIWEAGVRTMLGLEPAAEDPDEAASGQASPAAVPEPAQYAGVYRSDEGMLLELRPGDGGLQAVVEGVPHPLPVRFRDRDLAEIRIRSRRAPLLFLRDAAGEVWAVRFNLRVIRRALA